MADYAFKLKAQQWRDDPYYVASSMPVLELEVVASTQREAGKAAQEVLGPPHAHHYWRIWVESMRDIRIPEPDGFGSTPEGDASDTPSDPDVH